MNLELIYNKQILIPISWSPCTLYDDPDLVPLVDPTQPVTMVTGSEWGLTHIIVLFVTKRVGVFIRKPAFEKVPI